MKGKLMRIAALLSISVLSACTSLSPDYARPALDLPAGSDEATVPRSGERWWTAAPDRELAVLIDEALARNSDLLVAAQRVEQARSALTLARSAETPALWLEAGASRRLDPVPDIGILQKFNVQLAASWEADFWGRYRDASVAAREQLFATEAGRDALRLSLASQVAQSWYAWQSLQQRSELQQATLEAQREELRLNGLRAAVGLIGDFELRQLEAEIATTAALLHQLEAARERERNALGILLGRSPQALVAAKLPGRGAIVALTPPPLLPAGLPSSRLLARPDVQAAEATLRAANARIGVARSAWFPAISLTASAGTVSAELSGLFASGSGAFAFAAALVAPLFDSGRIGAGIDNARAEREAAAESYRQTVARAFRETLDAMIGRHAAEQSLKTENARVAALESTVTIARKRHRHGLIGQAELLAFERQLLSARSALIDAQRAEAASAVQLWTAIGG